MNESIEQKRERLNLLVNKWEKALAKCEADGAKGVKGMGIMAIICIEHLDSLDNQIANTYED